MDDQTVVIMAKITAMAKRMKHILEGSRICVIDADNEYKLYNSIQKAKDNIKLVLLDLDIEEDYAVSLLKETRERLENTPIIIMTKAQQRGYFIEALLHGATDFIIKPFSNDILLQKVMKYLVPEVQQNDTVTFDLSRYLKGELRKAEKGHFAISAMVLALDPKPGVSNDYTSSKLAGNILYENLKDIFWETDIFIRFEAKYYLGIFPFCDEKNTKIISQKIESSYELLKQNEKILKDYDLISVYVSYPFDTNDSTKIYELLLSRVKEQLKDEISANAM